MNAPLDGLSLSKYVRKQCTFVLDRNATFEFSKTHYTLR